MDINYRTLGRIMNKLNLICVVRPKRKVREIKNTNVKIKDLVNRDYNGITNNIIATDVSYIKAPNDIDENHVYLSVAIHDTKNITVPSSIMVEVFVVHRNGNFEEKMI